MEPIISQRPVSRATERWMIQEGWSPAAARIVAGRYDSIATAQKCFIPPASAMTPPSQLPDVDCAAKTIREAMTSGRKILIVCDYDADGTSGGAIVVRALREVFDVPRDQILLYSGSRFTEGYGLSSKLAERILGDMQGETALIITVDCGSSDEERIALLKGHGFDVIVTDHHEIPDQGPPASAIACVSPLIKDNNEYGDTLIAGCAVAWLLMAHLFSLVFDGIDPAIAKPKKQTLFGLLSFAGAGVVADCVSLSQSHNNRFFCQFGLNAIEAKIYPCWSAFMETLEPGERLSTSHISFSLAPCLNAAGRLTRADAAIEFLLADTVEEARTLLAELIQENDERKRIEKVMREQAVEEARRQFSDGAIAAVVFLPDGHPGVQGICASRVVEAFGRPCAIFSPKGDQSTVITASLRSVEGIHIREAIFKAAELLPEGGLKGAGGHAFAAGMSMERDCLDTFRDALNCACLELAAKNKAILKPRVEHDGEIPLHSVSLNLIEELSRLGPYGRGFPQPAFRFIARVTGTKRMGAEKNHLKLTLLDEESGVEQQAVQFFVDRIDGHEDPAIGQVVSIIAEINANWWRGQATPQLIVRHIDQRATGISSP